MRFLYHHNAGAAELHLDNEHFHYLVNVRRLRECVRLEMRNMRDECMYSYEIINICKKTLHLQLIESRVLPTQKLSPLHLLWAVIEPKVIEKTLPMLNELGVYRISFFYAAFSQRHFKLSLERMQKILISSSQQCGRSHLMGLQCYADMKAICKVQSSFYAFDFGGKDICDFKPYIQKTLDSVPDSIVSATSITSKASIEIPIMVGPEGGFSEEERAIFTRILSLDNGLTLRSESACVFLASMAQSWT